MQVERYRTNNIVEREGVCVMPCCGSVSPYQPVRPCPRKIPRRFEASSSATIPMPSGGTPLGKLTRLHQCSPKMPGRCHRIVLRLSDEKPFDSFGGRP